jgi:hypothetical protein
VARRGDGDGVRQRLGIISGRSKLSLSNLAVRLMGVSFFTGDIMTMRFKFSSSSLFLCWRYRLGVMEGDAQKMTPHSSFMFDFKDGLCGG